MLSGRTRRSTWRPKTLRELRFKRGEIVSLAHRHQLADVRVFGSLVRDQGGDASDVDLVVGRNEGATAADVAEFAAGIEDTLGCVVDVVVDNGEPAVARITAGAVPI